MTFLSFFFARGEGGLIRNKNKNKKEKSKAIDHRKKQKLVGIYRVPNRVPPASFRCETTRRGARGEGRGEHRQLHRGLHPSRLVDIMGTHDIRVARSPSTSYQDVHAPDPAVRPLSLSIHLDWPRAEGGRTSEIGHFRSRATGWDEHNMVLCEAAAGFWHDCRGSRWNHETATQGDGPDGRLTWSALLARHAIIASSTNPTPCQV